MTEFDVLVLTAVVSLGAVSLMWVVGVVAGRDPTAIDGYYGLASFVHGVVTYWAWTPRTTRGLALLIVTGAWSLGLSLQLGRRWLMDTRHKGGDPRFQVVYDLLRFGPGKPGFLWKSYVVLAFPQVLLIVLLNLPLQLAMMLPPSESLSALDVLALCVIVTGAVFEIGGNAQLRAFKRSGSSGRTLMTGLWALTRHPNYFGNVTVYCGCYLAAMNDPAYWWTIVAPVTITVMLRFGSGVVMTEKLMLQRRQNDPVYMHYLRPHAVLSAAAGFAATVPPHRAS